MTDPGNSENGEAMTEASVCADRCADRTMHEFYVAGAGFRWCRPMLDHLRPAYQGFRVGLNRYPHNVIGAYVTAFGHGLGIRWKRTPRG